VRLKINSLFDDNDVNEILTLLNSGSRRIVIPNLISRIALKRLLECVQHNDLDSLEIVLNDPFKLLLSAESFELVNVLESVKKSNLQITYFHKPALAAVTINPFYPQRTDHGFIPSYIEKDEFLKQMKANLSVPVFNVKDDGSERLFEVCLLRH
jgi:hypothetical protein